MMNQLQRDKGMVSSKRTNKQTKQTKKNGENTKYQLVMKEFQQNQPTKSNNKNSNSFSNISKNNL